MKPISCALKYISTLCLLVILLHVQFAHAQSTPVEETVTIENISTEIINGILINSKYLENEDFVHQKTLLPPGEKRSFTVKVWQGGSFTTSVHYRFKNEDKLSRPFTANLTNANPIAPVTLKFGGGQWGMWKEVIWEEPK